MTYEIALMRPGHKAWVVTRDELPAVYAELEEGNSPSVAWGDISEGGVVIVQVADDYSVATLGVDDTFYWLQASDDDEPVTVEIGGTDGEVPRGALVPRELGLEVLLRVDDLAALRTDYMWVEQ